MEDRYDYEEISEHSKQRSIRELNENPAQINAHIQSFRRWVKSMPHLTCPTNSKFLLQFLRVAKFNHAKAEKRLDNFCTVRTSMRGLPEYFKYFSIDDPIVEKFLNMKVQIPLGRTEDGELIVLHRFNEWDPDTLSLIDYMRLVFMGMDVMVSEEETQICGVTILIDINKVREKIVEIFSEPKIVKSLPKVFQDAYPLRLLSHLLYREPVMFDVVFKIIALMCKKKILHRVHRLKHDITKAIKIKPGIENLLPTEYNGLNGTLDECAERWNEKFKRYYLKGNPLSDIAVDESKRPKETLAYLGKNTESKGIKGTIVKFETSL